MRRPAVNPIELPCTYAEGDYMWTMDAYWLTTPALYICVDERNETAQCRLDVDGVTALRDHLTKWLEVVGAEQQATMAYHRGEQ